MARSLQGSGGDNKKLLLNINGRIVTASVDKVKPYKAGKSSSTNQSSSMGMDSILYRVISGESFFVKLRQGISSVEEQNNEHVLNKQDAPCQVLVTEILKLWDDRNNSFAFC